MRAKNMYARYPFNSPRNDSAERGAAWDEIVRLTFEACLNRSEGREYAAKRILQEALPVAIGKWSSKSGLSAGTCKQNLKAMFERVREQVAMASVQRRLILGDLRRNAAPSTSSQGSVAAAGNIFISRHIPIDDVSEMLDALAEAECVRSRPLERAIESIPVLSTQLAISA
jgi:hypothetical protein